RTRCREGDEEKDTEADAPRTPAEDAPDGRERMDCRCRGDAGSMGELTARRVDKRYGVQGPNDNPDPHLARAPGQHWGPHHVPVPRADPAPWARRSPRSLRPVGPRR